MQVLEETGFDVSKLLNMDDYIEVVIGQQRVRLYIITGVKEDTVFAPLTKKEISVWNNANFLIYPLTNKSLHRLIDWQDLLVYFASLYERPICLGFPKNPSQTKLFHVFGSNYIALEFFFLSNVLCFDFTCDSSVINFNILFSIAIISISFFSS